MDLKILIEKLIDQKLGRIMASKISYCTLKSLSPLCFIPEDNKKINIKEEFLVVPKYRVFTKKDLGKKFVIMSNNEGQTYFYLYEASDPQGSNGIPYNWKGEIKKCNLIGHCPDGEVVVTHGTIEFATHEEGLD